MAKSPNLNLLVAEYGHFAAFALAGILGVYFLIVMVGGPASGDLSVPEFRQQVERLRAAIEADDGVEPAERTEAQRVRSFTPVALTDRFATLPQEILGVPRPGMSFTARFEGFKGEPARDIEVTRAAAQEIHIRWRPSMSQDTTQYRVKVWAPGEGENEPLNNARVVESGSGLYLVPQIPSPSEDSWVQLRIENVQNNIRYRILVRSVDGSRARVDYTGNQPPLHVEENEAARAAGFNDQGLFVEVTPAGDQRVLPSPGNPHVASASLAGVRLRWDRVVPQSDTVDLEHIRVQLWRWYANDPENRTLLTPITVDRPYGWTLTNLSGTYLDTEIDPEQEIVYAIRFYHLQRYPDLDPSRAPRDRPVSVSMNARFGDEDRGTAYRGEIISIDYPERNRAGNIVEASGARQGQPARILPDETYVFATPLVLFDASELEEGRVFLPNRPLIEVLAYTPSDARAPHFGTARVRITKYFQVRDPESGEMVWERFGAPFEVGNTHRSMHRPIGYSRAPDYAAGEPIGRSKWDAFRTRNFDFSTSIIVIGLYELEYTLGARLRYVEFYDTESGRWPFKVYLSVLLDLDENEDLATFQASNNFGRTPGQMLELFSEYKAEIEYPARRAVAGDQRFVHGSMMDRVRQWMFEWNHAPRVRQDADAAPAPMWGFSRRHGLRYYPDSIARQSDNHRRFLDPQPMDHSDYTHWHNEVRRLTEWARARIGERWQALASEFGDEVTDEARQMALTPGYDEAIVPAIVRYVEQNLDAGGDLVVAKARLAVEALERTHRLSFDREIRSIDDVSAAMADLRRAVTDTYGG